MPQQITDTYKKRLSENLMKGIELTSFCLEIKKSFIKNKYDITSDDLLEKRLFSEIVAIKEKNWTLKKY
ncbi:MAG: hypothetical protein V1872_14920 [bacterium]